MPEQRTVYIVDDDADVMELEARLLRNEGYAVQTSASSLSALKAIVNSCPRIIVLDIMLPEMDGLELCQKLRECHDLDSSSIIICSAKAYEFDRRRAYKLGANGYIEKPIDVESFASRVRDIAARRIAVTFWGVRGTLPVPGHHSVRYGGNTSCVSVALPQERFLIFDAGTGIKNLSDNLKANDNMALSAKILITHPHWDHINALPFFAPLYHSGNEFEICGPAHGALSMRELIAAQMDDVYFPITLKQFSARVYFRDLREGHYEIDGIDVSTLLLTHPGSCLGYRVNYGERSICYITDNELYPESSPAYSRHERERLTKFTYATDVLIIDSTYFDEEYPDKAGWGHSCLTEVAKFAHKAKVKQLCLFHHDPGQTDDDIDTKLATVQALLREHNSSTVCLAPRENDTITLSTPASTSGDPSDALDGRVTC